MAIHLGLVAIKVSIYEYRERLLVLGDDEDPPGEMTVLYKNEEELKAAHNLLFVNRQTFSLEVVCTSPELSELFRTVHGEFPASYRIKVCQQGYDRFHGPTLKVVYQRVEV